MSRRNLAVADLTRTADINDKLAVLDELTQHLTDLGYADASIIAAGILGIMNGGTGANLSTTGGASQFLKQASAGAAITVVQPAASDLSNGTTGSGGGVVLATSPTITTPTIASFTNATHNHTNAAGGGQITTAALSDYTTWTTFTPTRSAATGTWTAGTVVARYRIIGKSMRIQLYVTGSTLSNATASISFTIPASATVSSSAARLVEFFHAIDSATDKVGLLSVSASATTVTLYTSIAQAGWAASTTATDVNVDIELDIA